MANKMNGDKSAWIDQIERARHDLMLAIKSGRLTTEWALRASIIDAETQRLIDAVIDAETMRRAA